MVAEQGGRYSQGWGKESKSVTIPAECMKGKTFEQIKAECQKAKKLWEDPDFPANDATINPHEKPRKPLTWKRPPELAKDAKMFVGGASRFDIQQGELGDCWLLASVASLCQNEDALKCVVPHDQDFDKDYIGAMRFNFWQFGQWVEVVVDDRLPTHQDRLVFLHSASNNEFWTALFEKAYAKLFGSYEALSGGNATEAMEDFTGGVTEVFDTRKELPANFYKLLYKARERNSLMGCSIEDMPGCSETALPNGLIAGHAYSITDVRTLDVKRGSKTETLEMVRVRNPWGNECEWKGAWGDASPEWKNVPEAKRNEMLSVGNDGEFWMTFSDFKANFHKVEICNLSPEELGDDMKDKSKRKWEVSVQEGAWKKNVNAGGCINNRDTFWTNPQYQVEVVDADENDDEDLGTIIVGLMQKESRKKKAAGGKAVSIGMMIYEMPAGETGLLDCKFFKSHPPAAKSPPFCNSREVCTRFKIKPGKYCIVPSTFKPNEEASFILRLFSEKENKTGEMDEQTAILDKPPAPAGKAATSPAAAARDDQKTEALFKRNADKDGEIDAYKLRTMLDTEFQKEIKYDGFSVDTCKSLVAMMDLDHSGKLGIDEFKTLWNNVTEWKNVFKKFDADKSGNFNSYEMREALRSAGYAVTNATFNALVQRFSSQDGKIYFDYFVACIARLKTMFEVFAEMRRGDKAEFTLDQFVQTTMYS